MKWHQHIKGFGFEIRKQHALMALEKAAVKGQMLPYLSQSIKNRTAPATVL